MSNTSLTSKVSQSRGWTLALGIGAAALAAILLIAYLVQYRSSVNDSTAPTPVLVAKNLIPKGTSGIVIAEKQLFQAATLAKDDLKVGAISDPAYLNGRVAVGRHLPRPADHDRRPQRRPDRRDPDAAHGQAAGRRDPGRRRPRARRLRRERRPRRHLLRDRAHGGTVLGLLAPNVLVMRAPAAEGQPAILRADAGMAQKLALAADTGTLWFLLRPAGDAKNAAEEVDHERPAPARRSTGSR